MTFDTAFAFRAIPVDASVQITRTPPTMNIQMLLTHTGVVTPVDGA